MYADPNYWWHAQEAKSVNLTGNNEEFILHKKYLPNVFKLVFEFKKTVWLIWAADWKIVGIFYLMGFLVTLTA